MPLSSLSTVFSSFTSASSGRLSSIFFFGFQHNIHNTHFWFRLSAISPDVSCFCTINILFKYMKSSGQNIHTLVLEQNISRFWSPWVMKNHKLQIFLFVFSICLNGTANKQTGCIRVRKDLEFCQIGSLSGSIWPSLALFFLELTHSTTVLHPSNLAFLYKKNYSENRN